MPASRQRSPGMPLTTVRNSSAWDPDFLVGAGFNGPAGVSRKAPATGEEALRSCSVGCLSSLVLFPWPHLPPAGEVVIGNVPCHGATLWEKSGKL